MTKVRITAMARITSNGSGGRARVITCVHKHWISIDQLTNRAFTNYPTGTNMVVELEYCLETKIRRILSATVMSGGIMDFENKYRTLMEEQEKWCQLAENSGKTPSYMDPIGPITFTPEPEPVAKWCDSFYVQGEERNAFDMAKAICGTLPAKVMIIGASGYGKTSLPKAFAKQHGMKYVRFNVALVRDPEEFFGWRTVDGGDVKFMPSEFTTAIKEGNAVVVLDELNRATPEMANALFPILDDEARTVVFGEEIQVGPNVIIVATINVGFQFVGTFSIDQALLNRMDITLRVAPLPKNVEREILVRRTGIDSDKASTIVEVCNRLRTLTNDGKIVVDASTRTSIRVARFVAQGASFQDAFAWAIVNGSDIEERKEIIDTISSIV
jgi:nitric oxide reductase NorQ protein